MKRLTLLFLPLLFIWSCAGDPKMLPMRDTSLDPAGAEKGMKTVEFPKGTWTGTASTEQAGTLAQIFVNSHNMAMREFDQVKDNQEKMKGSLQNVKESAQRLEESNQKILASAQKNQDTAEKNLMRIEKLVQGAGVRGDYPVLPHRVRENCGRVPGTRSTGPVCGLPLPGKPRSEGVVCQYRQRLGDRQ